MKNKDLERLTFLRNYLGYHGNLYYVQDKPEISDVIYDTLFRELLKLEDKYPEHFSLSSPIHRVGGQVLKELKSVSLDTPMKSLDNAFNLDEAKLSIKKMCNAAGIPCVDGKLDIVLEPKIDGLALEHTYVDGLLSESKTRGNGTVGELVTHTARTICSLPLMLLNSNDFSRIQVRGEAFMPVASLDSFNDYAESEGIAPLSNCRNGASGSIRQLDSAKAAKRKLDFIAYAIAEVDGNEDLIPDSHFEMLKFISTLGFKINPLMKKISSFKELEVYYNHILEVRNSLGYEIDGIVIKLDSRKDQDEAGYTNRAAKFAVALKLPPQESVTTILSVDQEVGKSGAITPVANVVPTLVGGVTVSRVSLYNFGDIKEKGLAIGDTVTLYRAGEVVPKIGLKVKNGENRISIEEPSTCPCCGSATQREADIKGVVGEVLYCTDRKSVV